MQAPEALCCDAGHLAERYALRGYDDSISFDAFLEIAREWSEQLTEFSSFDDRLNRAARLAARNPPT